MSITVDAYSPVSGTHVFTARNAAGQWWRTDTSVFETYNATNIATYAITATSKGLGWYQGTLPDLSIAYDLRLRAGASLATTDAVIWTGDTAAAAIKIVTDALSPRLPGSGTISTLAGVAQTADNSPAIASMSALISTWTPVSIADLPLYTEPPTEDAIASAVTGSTPFTDLADAVDEVAAGVGHGGFSADDRVLLTNVPARNWAYGDRRNTDGVIVQSPVTQRRSREIIQGDTYGPTARTLAAMASDGGEWPVDLSDFEWACTFAPLDAKGNVGAVTFTAAVSVTDATGESRSLAIAITSAQSADLAVGKYLYKVTGVDGAERWTPEEGMTEVMP
jgi:hypothetical protein